MPQSISTVITVNNSLVDQLNSWANEFAQNVGGEFVELQEILSNANQTILDDGFASIDAAIAKSDSDFASNAQVSGAISDTLNAAKRIFLAIKDLSLDGGLADRANITTAMNQVATEKNNLHRV